MRDAMPQLINTPEIRIECVEERKFDIVEEVRARLKTQTDITINEIDGVRVSTDDGWWLLRASNTQAVLVARCESDTQEGLTRLKGLLSAQLAASGITPPDLG